MISEEEYNEFLRQQTDIADLEGKYRQLLDQFHDLITDQKNLTDNVAALQSQTNAPPAAQAEHNQQLDALTARQNEINRKLDQLAKRMEDFVRPVPLYDVEAELQEQLRQTADRIRASTGTNDLDMAQVAQLSSPRPPAGPWSPAARDAFQSAAEQQLGRLNPAEGQARKDVLSTLEDMSLMQELMKDFNRFEALFHVQEGVSGQAAPYNREGPLNRDEQLALKTLAATEHDMTGALADLEQKLRRDAEAAGELFPKASRGANDLADQIKDNRLQPLARLATGSMLAAQGDKSFQLADRLRSEMEKMFSQCQSGGSCPNQSELDTYLRLQRGMKAGNSFRQMLQCRKFGSSPGKGMAASAAGAGTGMEGASGFAVLTGPTMGVLGGETFVSQPAEDSTQAGHGFGPGSQVNGGPAVAYDPADVLGHVKTVNRSSEAVTAESVIDEYNEIVDRYFEAITR